MKKLILLLLLTFNAAFTQINTGDFYFTDFATYTKWKPTTILSSGLNIKTTTNEFINTGIMVDSSVYSIEIFGTCAQNSAAHFGFGLKDGNAFKNILYRGSTGGVQSLLYNSTTIQAPDFRASNSAYSYQVGSVVSVKVYFEDGRVNFKTSVNGNYSPMVTATNSTFTNFGELVICIRSASTWNNVHVNIQTADNYKQNVWIAPFGNDNNNGSIFSPFKSVAKGIDETKGLGTVNAFAGDYNDDLTLDFRRNINLKGASRYETRFIYGERITSANLLTGSSRVYEITHVPLTGTVAKVVNWQMNVNDINTAIPQNEQHPLQNGKVYRMENLKSTYRSSLALLESSPSNESHWYQANGKIYFTIAEGTKLEHNPFVIPSRGSGALNHYLIGNGKRNVSVQLSNFTILFAPVNLSYTTFNLENISASASNSSYIFQYGYCTRSTFVNCEASGCNYHTGSVGDGFNAHSDNPINNATYETDVLLTDCYAHDNMDDGISWHQYCFSNVTNCLVEYNGAGITPASGGDGVITGCTANKNHSTGFSVQGQPLDGSAFTQGDFIDCTAINNGQNFVKDNYSTTIFNATDCTAKGTGNGFGSNINASNCTYVP